MQQSPYNYDLIVIGGGSGGLAAAEQAAQLGKRVLLIEFKAMGGTCVNNGCVPKKVMWNAANTAHEIQHARDYGFTVESMTFDWSSLIDSREDYIDSIKSYWDDYVLEQGIEVVHGSARFIDNTTVEVNDTRYSSAHIVIATGSQPIVPRLPGAELGITSDGFFALQEQPKRVAIVGGGYIAVELAGLLNALGSSVTVVALENRILERFDGLISCRLRKEMQAQGIQVETGIEVTGLSRLDERIYLHNKQDKSLQGFDTVIWAIGRRANTQSLQLHNTDVSVEANGIISVDVYDNTSVRGIYAIGDINGKPALTPVAIASGRKLATRLFGESQNAHVDVSNIPSVVFSHPPVATIGMTEAEARREHPDSITTYTSEFTPMQHSLGNHEIRTAMKLVCEGPHEKIVGIHMIGSGVDEMLQGFAVAIKMGATKRDFDNTIAIHPSSAEELVTMKTPDHEKSELTTCQKEMLYA